MRRHRLANRNTYPMRGRQRPLPHDRGDGIPRRNDVSLNTSAELAIRNAIDEVEELGADLRLTDVIIKLADALNALADYLEADPNGEA